MTSDPWIRQFELETAAGSIRVREWGNPDGTLIVFHHGTPSSSSSVPGGWTGPTDAGVRVCSYDRPGYGASSPVPGRTIGDAAEWSRRIADACEVEQFAVMGTSGGGPHAVAAAVALPNRVRALCVDVGLGPESFGFDASTGMVPETTVEIEAARRGEATLRSHLQSLGDGEDSLADWYERLPPSDQEVLARPEVQREDAFESREWPTFGIDGWVEDDLALFHRGWGLSSISVHVPTLLLYGGADVLVPVSHGHAWHRLIPHAEVKTIPNGGHWLRDHEVDALRWCSSIVRSDDS